MSMALACRKAWLAGELSTTPQRLLYEPLRGSGLGEGKEARYEAG